ncbi:MAG: PqqD family protein [Candidatus Rokubacteria bacterium]|nr:PqqD family protein [Candidatus Rokubacteria bacterium]
MAGGGLPPSVRFAESVTLKVGPERGFLFDQRTGRVYSLNGSAALASFRLSEGAATQDVIAAVLEAFEVDLETVRADLARFVAQLVEEGLASVDG